MRRLIALITAASFAAATPVFAQSTPVRSASPAPGIGQTSDSEALTPDQSLLLDGQDAYAQATNGGPTTSPDLNPGLLLGIGVAGAAAVAIGIGLNNKSSTSP